MLKPYAFCPALLALALALPSSAAADRSGLEDAAPLLMPDTSERTRAGIDVSATTFNNELDVPFFELASSGTVLSFEPYLSVALTPELSAWGRMPVAHVSLEASSVAGTSSDSATVLGNLGAGVRYMHQLSRELRIGGGLALHLPTATSGDDSAFSSTAASMRVFYGERYLPDTTNISAQLDLRYDLGRAFVQGQLALLHDRVEDDDNYNLLRLGAAAGFWFTPTLTAIAEYTALSSHLEDDLSIDQDEGEAVHSLDFGLRYSQPTWSLAARFYLPLDDQYRDIGLLGGGLDFSVYL